MTENTKLDIVVTKQERGVITFNKEALKERLTQELSTYQGRVYTEDQVPEAKTKRAQLNKLKKHMDDKRKEYKKDMMIPYAEFEADVKELMAMVDPVVTAIDEQLKVFQDKWDDARTVFIDETFRELKGELDIPLKLVYQDSFKNKTTSPTKIKTTMTNTIRDIMSAITFITGSFPDFKEELIKIIYDGGSQADVMIKMNEINLIKQKALEADELKKSQAAKKQADDLITQEANRVEALRVAKEKAEAEEKAIAEKKATLVQADIVEYVNAGALDSEIAALDKAEEEVKTEAQLKIQKEMAKRFPEATLVVAPVAPAPAPVIQTVADKLIVCNVRITMMLSQKDTLKRIFTENKMKYEAI